MFFKRKKDIVSLFKDFASEFAEYDRESQVYMLKELERIMKKKEVVK